MTSVVLVQHVDRTAHQIQADVYLYPVQGPNGLSKTGFKLSPDITRRARLQILFI
jgi:hypothetical protein